MLNRKSSCVHFSMKKIVTNRCVPKRCHLIIENNRVVRHGVEVCSKDPFRVSCTRFDAIHMQYSQLVFGLRSTGSLLFFSCILFCVGSGGLAAEKMEVRRSAAAKSAKNGPKMGGRGGGRRGAGEAGEGGEGAQQRRGGMVGSEHLTLARRGGSGTADDAPGNRLGLVGARGGHWRGAGVQEH